METSRILLVEDERRMADMLRTGLEENGFEVELAFNGSIGFRVFKSQKFDLVILDIQLPGIDGYELCRQIRTINQRIPVIMLTALSTIDDKVEGYDAGTDDFLVKPFEFRELIMKIKVLLRRSLESQITDAHMLQAGDLVMNVDEKLVTRGNDSIMLTAKEFQLLEFLLKNKNRVVSRSDIAISVWDIDFDTNTNIIDVYINYLRNKIDKPYPNKLIHTQVGMGYMLKEKP